MAAVAFHADGDRAWLEAVACAPCAGRDAQCGEEDVFDARREGGGDVADEGSGEVGGNRDLDLSGCGVSVALRVDAPLAEERLCGVGDGVPVLELVGEVGVACAFGQCVGPCGDGGSGGEQVVFGGAGFECPGVCEVVLKDAPGDSVDGEVVDDHDEAAGGVTEVGVVGVGVTGVGAPQGAPQNPVRRIELPGEPCRLGSDVCRPARSGPAVGEFGGVESGGDLDRGGGAGEVWCAGVVDVEAALQGRVMSDDAGEDSVEGVGGEVGWGGEDEGLGEVVEAGSVYVAGGDGLQWCGGDGGGSGFGVGLGVGVGDSCQGADGAVGEDVGGGDGDAGAAGCGDDLDGGDGVAAEAEEVVVDRQWGVGGQVQDVGEDGGEGGFGDRGGVLSAGECSGEVGCG